MNRPKLATAALILTTLGLAIAVQHTSGPAHAAAVVPGPAAVDTNMASAPTAPTAPTVPTTAATVIAGATTSAPATDDNVRGVVRAVREATLSSRLAARILEMPLAEGASFKSGALLVRFDCERQAAEARAAAAAAEAQKKTVETNVELDKFESIGKNDLAISRSVFDKADAEAEALKVQLKDCNLYAPFSGRVTERLARNFEAVTVSQPLLRIVDTTELELDVIVPSKWLQWLAEGKNFEFRVDETGQTLTAKVLRVTPAVDPVSKTIRIIGQFRGGNGLDRVLPGMSGTASFASKNG
jgi:RND family efflux transporter MFP subunit